MRTLKWIGIGMLLAVGCGGSSVSIEDFPQRYAQAICSKNFKCCPPSELEGKTQSTCVTDNQTVISLLIGSINESQARGRASYDASQSGTCIDSLNSMTCDEFKQGIGGNMAACMAFVTPKVAQGGACTQDFECTTGNCEGEDTGVDPPVDGMCAAAISLAPIGASCSSIECVDGAYCDFNTSTCQKLKGAGEACTSDLECANACDTATNTCTCYAGCSVAGTTAGSTALSLLLFGAGLVFTRRRRARSR